MDLRDAVVVVTGASAGIGRATALAFAREGSRVVVSARRQDRLRELSEEIRRHGRQALAVECDVTEPAQVDRLRDRVRQEFGRCDVLVNNAGVPGSGPFLESSIEQTERVVRVNYLGVLYATKAFLPMMREAGKGHVVNVASLAGRFATPGSAVYSSTKHAVVAFSEALHYEVAPLGILVTTVNPGLVVTESFPHREAVEHGRTLLTPEDVSRVIVHVVKRGIAPERSVPRWQASLQVFRLLTPPLYRFAVREITKRRARPTQAREG